MSGARWQHTLSEAEKQKVSEKISKAVRRYYESHSPPNLGKQSPDETRKRISETRKELFAKKALTSYPRTELEKQKMRDGQKRQEMEIVRYIEELRSQGYEVVRVDKVMVPDALAKKDGNLYAVEVHRHTDSAKQRDKRDRYISSGFYDGVLLHDYG